jgi:hypothetical protein
MPRFLRGHVLRGPAGQITTLAKARNHSLFLVSCLREALHYILGGIFRTWAVAKEKAQCQRVASCMGYASVFGL